MRTVLAVLVLTLMALPASAQSCYQWGNQTTCENGATFNRYGNEPAVVGGNTGVGTGPVGTIIYGNAPPASAQGCYQWGNQAACNNGVTINRYGNETITAGSQPTIGNSTVGATNGNGSAGATTSQNPLAPLSNSPIAGVPNGVTYRVQGNTVYLSDGTTAIIQGNTVTFSNGRTCRGYGTSSVCN
jgi:hypothetical protein